jgi:hypothetical protein
MVKWGASSDGILASIEKCPERSSGEAEEGDKP